MLKSLFRTRPIERPGDRLYAAAVAQARSPGFYTVMGAPDRIDTRFELYTLHVLLLALRLRAEAAGRDESQALFDAYVSALDNALRELGVGDISMAKKMRRLGEQVYGRMTAWEAPLSAGDVGALGEAMARNVYEAPADERSARLAAYALQARRRLAAQSLDQVRAQPDWPEAA